ncbi:MAG TPA: hypothetical protein VNP98_11480 [Chthoniobacterales bacterium]|nr:hypothetical protein [Chthoniobacterales bacterium]
MIVRIPFLFSRWLGIALIATGLWSFGPAARGVLLFRSGDPAANTTEPTGALAGSGWQYQGRFGNFLGTAIAPHYFITAKHLGTGPPHFVFHGVNYTVLDSFPDPASDLRIFRVAETLPVYAPLYTRSDELGQNLVVIGRGTQRGEDRVVNGQLRGWLYGPSDNVQRWGENQVSSVLGGMIRVLFDQGGLPHEAHISDGDSGGAVFLKDGSVWKLAGINSDVDRFASGPDGGGPYSAALFDMRGSYRSDGTLVTGDTPVPSGFFVTRISSRLSWITSIIGSSNPGLANISARVTLGTGDRVCIGGFIIQGQPKRVGIRGLGPSIEVGGVPLPGRIADPMLELYNAAGAVIFFNDNWRSSQATEIENSGLAPGSDMEAALIATLPTGHFTAVLRDTAGSTGIGLVEIYDLDPAGNSQLLNLAARAYVGAGDDVLIGGLIVQSVSMTLLLRALGPELAAHGVTGELGDPALELHDFNGAILASNDDWSDAPNSAEIFATGLAPIDGRESAVLAMLGPGSYTAIVRGLDGPGVGLLEAYLIN